MGPPGTSPPPRAKTKKTPVPNALLRIIPEGLSVSMGYCVLRLFLAPITIHPKPKVPTTAPVFPQAEAIPWHVLAAGCFSFKPAKTVGEQVPPASRNKGRPPTDHSGQGKNP